MSYQPELDKFIKKVKLDNPNDFFQYGAQYFQNKLQTQREYLKNIESKALEHGLILFPSNITHDIKNDDINDGKNENGANISNDDVLFKSPFVDSDPHTAHHIIEQDNNSNNVEDSTNKGKLADFSLAHDDPHNTKGNSDVKDKNDKNSNGGIFKGGFTVGSESNKKKESPLDPMAPIPSLSNSSTKNTKPDARPRRSIVNPKPLPFNFNAQRRTSVSGETLKPDTFYLNDDELLSANKKSKKSEEQLKRLSKAIGDNFLFKKLDSDSKKLVINSLQEKFIGQGEEIIKQGDEGDYFYIVENGTVEFFVNNEKVNTSGPGSSFGELALMYNSPRAATVIAKTDCILWSLDRLTFRKILLGGSFKKRVLYDEFLKSVPILKSLTTYDRAKLADALDTAYYKSGDVIIKEGDVGENFYFIERGAADVLKKGHTEPIAHLKAGDYFGEVALLNDLPRQATIKATEATKVATLGKSGFQRLLGPCVEVLKLNDPTRR
ncbi:probable cAMP-dependent protein kinase regulatory subunit [Saccharomycodes ludwigii]|uniref:cAMP-dependent protein kinase regulatory subunit n=1 Tax=Saccharomycodes ludwigii TaxID=36035 RepID=A0A376B5D9_9ASCO|nr:hypothetical protein SCDLUD_000387 [Saccharomycodes ludwigii]KAH3902796.1 hypothetical protein SCDLUD_000387 [Saccharomycodes ludwigii]SSD59350.1 probable cAMP-dependent protein kinase regulatory subunit [Saccharomycodes ludwigii]